MTKLSTEKKISYADMRLELGKIEAEMTKLADEKTKPLTRLDKMSVCDPGGKIRVKSGQIS